MEDKKIKPLITSVLDLLNYIITRSIAFYLLYYCICYGFIAMLALCKGAVIFFIFNLPVDLGISYLVWLALVDHSTHR